MGIVDDIRLGRASARITEEVLYAEVLREIQSGIRRDGLWAMALSQTNMREEEAQAMYIKLRVQALKDEIENQRNEERLALAKAEAAERAAIKRERDRPPQALQEWVSVLVGSVVLAAAFALVSYLAIVLWP